MPPLGISFDSEAFTRGFIGRRSKRCLQQFLDGIGSDNLAFLISQNKNLVDYISPDEKYTYKSLMQHYKDYAQFFKDDDIYSWFPEEWKSIIEEQPGGKEWAFQQIAFIRSFFFPS